MSVYKKGERVFSDYDLAKLDEAIRANRIAAEKDEASDRAFAEQFISGTGRSARSRTTSANNRRRAYEKAEAKADDLFWGLGGGAFDDVVRDLSTEIDLGVRADGLEALRDELRDATNLSELLGVDR